MWHKLADGTVVNKDGKIIYFSTKRFVQDICFDNCCFICGASPFSTKFNDEHVIPVWILRRYQMFDQTITLPNGHKVRYDRYTIPCCVDCNSWLGNNIEKPVSDLVRAGADAMRDYIKSKGPYSLFVWMALVFLKVHLRDRKHRVQLDARKSDSRIADLYDWTFLHHIQALIRAAYTGSALGTGVLGSFAIMHVKYGLMVKEFDFGSLYKAQTVLMRLGDVGMVAVLNDACAALHCMKATFDKIEGPLSDLQLREIFAKMAFVNLHLKEHPVFHSDIDIGSEVHLIGATLPPLQLKEFNFKILGVLLYRALKEAFPIIRIPGLSHDDMVKAVRSGTFSSLFDKDGKFIKGGITAVRFEKF